MFDHPLILRKPYSYKKRNIRSNRSCRGDLYAFLFLRQISICFFTFSSHCEIFYEYLEYSSERYGEEYPDYSEETCHDRHHEEDEKR